MSENRQIEVAGNKIVNALYEWKAAEEDSEDGSVDSDGEEEEHAEDDSVDSDGGFSNDWDYIGANTHDSMPLIMVKLYGDAVDDVLVMMPALSY